MLKLFSLIFTPILLYIQSYIYDCEVWGPYLLGKINSFQLFKSQILHISSEIEKLHLNSVKELIFGVSKARNIAVYGESGRTSLIFVRVYYSQRRLLMKQQNMFGAQPKTSDIS